MTDFQAIMADFAVRQAERAAQAQSEIQRLKAAIIAPLRNAEIARVEIRFDGCGDSGAVEECVFSDVGGASVPCPEVTIDCAGEGDDQSLNSALVELPADLRLSRLGRGPTRWYVRSIWEEYTGWFRQDLTSELYASPGVSIGPILAKMLGGPDALAAKAEELRAQGALEQALHMIELAIAAAGESPAVRQIEARILVDLINATGGEGFDEIGWLESKLLDAREVIERTVGNLN